MKSNRSAWWVSIGLSLVLFCPPGPSVHAEGSNSVQASDPSPTAPRLKPRRPGRIKRCQAYLMINDDDRLTGGTFEAQTKDRWTQYEQALEITAAEHIRAKRDELAKIENANPIGFNTYAYSNRQALRVQVRALLRLGQERRVKMLFGKAIEDMKELFRQREAQQQLESEALEEFFASDLNQRNGLDALIKATIDNRAKLNREIGKNIFVYSGVVTALLEDAGLRPRSGLLAEGIERALIDDQVNAFSRTVALESMPGTGAPSAPPAASPEVLAKSTALRVLQSLRLVASDGKTEIRPTVDDFEALLISSAIMRDAKLESEIAFERRQQRIQRLLSYVSDQYLMGLLVTGLNALTLKQFKDFFDGARAELEKGMNQEVHRGRILWFLGMADALSDDVTGNQQLTQALIQLLGADPAMLSSLAVTQEAILPLKRVKSTPLAKETIWGPKGQKLSEAIEELEGRRSTEMTNAIDGAKRSHFALKATVIGLMTYASVAHLAALQQISSGGFEALKSLILGLFN